MVNHCSHKPFNTSSPTRGLVVKPAPSLAQMVDEIEKNEARVFALASHKTKSPTELIESQQKVDPIRGVKKKDGRLTHRGESVFSPKSQNQQKLLAKIKLGSRVRFLHPSGLNTDGSRDLSVLTGKAMLRAANGGWVCKVRHGCEIASAGMLLGKAK